MIRRIKLQNWRAYEMAEISFDEGTTFVVAPNGIGKSSLLEAVNFAITGHIDSEVGPVSLGADAAVVEIALQVPSGGDVLVIRRTLPADPNSPGDVTITMNDDTLSERAFAAELDRSFRSTPTFLARNALLRDGLRNVEHSNLRALLARAFDLDAKRAEAEQLAARAADLNTTAEKLSKEIRAEARRAGQIDVELNEAQVVLTRTQSELLGARETLEELSAERAVYLEGATAMRRLAEWDVAATALLTKARAFIPAVNVDTLRVSVESTLSAAEQSLQDASERAALLRARIDMVQAALAELDSAGADCPVCRRPLDLGDRDSAHDAHEHDLSTLAAEIAEVDVETERARVGELRTFARDVASLGTRPEGPGDGPVPEDPQEQFDVARARLEQLVAESAAAEAKVSDLTAALAQAQAADEKAAESERAWRRWALTHAASDTLFAAIDDVLNDEIKPIQRDVARRWNGLFIDRPDLEFDLDGTLWREINGERLRLEGFSAGEQTAARLLMQVAILTTATNADFCWFDEPLETLDPRTRRRVAALLAQGRKATGLRQLVVTTYEEELAAHLAETEADARIEYIRAGPKDAGASE